MAFQCLVVDIPSHGDIFERKQIALDLVREIKEHMNEGAFYEFIAHNGDEEEPLVVFSVLQTKKSIILKYTKKGTLI